MAKPLKTYEIFLYKKPHTRPASLGLATNPQVAISQAERLADSYPVGWIIKVVSNHKKDVIFSTEGKRDKTKWNE